MKMNSEHLDETVAKIKEILPDNLAEFKQSGEDKLKIVLEGLLQRLDMVPREEYDVQVEVLQRTRQRLEQLEQRLALLEKN